MYLHKNIVETAFRRLGEIDSGGKLGQECTSGLMYFLAFQKTRKSQASEKILDFNPDTGIGSQNRDAMSNAFSKLITLCACPQPGEFPQAVNLGQVKCDNKSPEKRISSNFFTVPLKKASNSSDPVDYPNRRHGPLFKMGKLTPRLAWGIQAHDDWLASLAAILSERKSNTPFTDLAIFAFKDSKFDQPGSSLMKTLSSLIGKQYPEDFAEIWQRRIQLESRHHKSTEPLYSEHYINPFSTQEWLRKKSTDPQGDRSMLEDRIKYLESILRENNITYN